jgi:hypothetical protein
VNPEGYENYNPINVIDYVNKVKILVSTGNPAYNSLIACFDGDLNSCTLRNR